MISLCTYRPAPAISRQQPCIRLRCRDFTYAAFHFASERQAQDVFDTVRNLTCRLARLEQLYAFTFQPQGPERNINGWAVYNPMQEWRRLGIVSKGNTNGWRISNINAEYEYCPTYPALLAIPSHVSDNVLNYAGRYRSRARVPVLTYLHSVNDCSISRSSQPLVGVRGNRSVQDEKLVAAIFETSKPAAGSGHPPVHDISDDSAPHSRTSSGIQTPKLSQETSDQSLERVEDDAIAQLQDRHHREVSEAHQGRQLYGAQQSNLIVDARPTVNALAMQAVGMGSENMDHYPFATKAYLGIDNIHVMRESLNKVVEALKDSDITPLPPNRDGLAKSNWIRHITNLLDGASLIARQIGIHHSHVLIHCSDGWDRTSQLSALAQLCLDPYYRTLEGFMVLIEKDFVSFGHMFNYRSGFLGSEKWFDIENERVGGVESPFGSSNHRGNLGSGKAFENALLSAKGFFNKHTQNQNNNGRETVAEADELASYEKGSPTRTASPSSRKDDPTRPLTRVKETSPVFHQFLDATYQILSQHTNRFEFNERFLRRLHYHLYSCQYGTFLYDNEKQRVEAKVKERTRSAWDYFLARREMFVNTEYDPHVDDNVRGKERLIFPDLNQVKWWVELFGRTSEEMNAPVRSVAPMADAHHNPSSRPEPESSSTLLHEAGEEGTKEGDGETAPSYAIQEPALVRVETSTQQSMEESEASKSSVQGFPSTGLGAGNLANSTSPSRRVDSTAAVAAGLADMNLGAHVKAESEPTYERGQAVEKALGVEMQ